MAVARSRRTQTHDRSGAVDIYGLRELQRGLASAGPQFRALLGKANKTVSEDLIAAPARRRAASLGKGQAHLARPGVIKAAGTAKSAGVRLSATSGYPDAFAQEFGRNQTAGWLRHSLVRSHQSVFDSYGQFRYWRGNAYETTWAPGLGGAGWALYPTIRAAQPRIVEEYLDRIMGSLAQAFPEEA